MKTISILAMLFSLLLTFPAHARGSRGSSRSYGSPTRVRTYTKNNGTSVGSHRRSAPNHTKSDNWSSKDNVNPDTGKEGSK